MSTSISVTCEIEQKIKQKCVYLSAGEHSPENGHGEAGEMSEGHAAHVEEINVAGERLLFHHADVAQHEDEFEAAARGEGSGVSVTELVERHPASGRRQPLHREHVPATQK